MWDTTAWENTAWESTSWEGCETGIVVNRSQNRTRYMRGAFWYYFLFIVSLGFVR